MTRRTPTTAPSPPPLSELEMTHAKSSNRARSAVDPHTDDDGGGGGGGWDRASQLLWGKRYIDDSVFQREGLNSLGSPQWSSPTYTLTGPMFSVLIAHCALALGS